ncbi:MAG: Rieske 2Fe-2S domain-containing protein [Thiolinea sp.]
MASVPVGLTDNLPAGRVMRAWVEGAELVVWRSASGKLSAWDNRCPHRGMRLSHGFVRGESLACIYHGWHYGTEGQCHYIPAHPELTPHKSICTVSHEITEQNGVLWVTQQSQTDLPPIPAGLQAVRTITFECPPDLLLDCLGNSEIVDENGVRLLAGKTPSFPMMLTYSADTSDFIVILLVQKVVEHSANVHMLCSQHWSVAGKVSLSRWCDATRRRVEDLHDSAGVER